MTDPYYRNDQVTVYQGDCLDVLPELADNSIDSVCTDPPYELAFMGRAWDRAGIAFNPEVWKHCHRVLKPGGHLLAFGGTRTWHRLACAIEDAGFEIRDSIAWLYGSGFPKSLDVSKAIDKAAGAEREVVGPSARHVSGKPEQRIEGLTGSSTFAESVGMGAFITAPATDAAQQWRGWGTALKPAHEPIVVARKPLTGTVANNVLEHGTGALNIDASRVAHDDPVKTATRTVGKFAGSAYAKDDYSVNMDGGAMASANPAGRWPTNVVIDQHTAAGIDQQSGNLTVTGFRSDNSRNAKVEGTHWGTDNHQSREYPGEAPGGASRFFPTFRYEPKAPSAERPTADGTSHPTVKPLDLMRWLVRLVTPPHGLVLDPFAGSGTTAEAAIHEHMRCTTIEREAEYLPVITARLNKPMQVGFDYEEFDT